MTKKTNGAPTPPAALKLWDVYYILFRHKWMILILLAMGVAGATVVKTAVSFPYTSEAKILIRYVQETVAPTGSEGAKTRIIDDEYATQILNTEQQILTSRDLAMTVASIIGATNILGPGSSTNEIDRAAGVIRQNLVTEIPRDNSVIVLHYTSKDPEIVQRVLNELIAAYKISYQAIHLSSGLSTDSLNDKTTRASEKLAAARLALTDVKQKHHVIEIEGDLKNLAALLAKKTDEVMQAQEDLAMAHSGEIGLYIRMTNSMWSAGATNQITNMPLASAEEPLTPDLMAQYQQLNAILNTGRNNEQQLKSQFTTNNWKVQLAQKQRMEAEDKLRQFEREHPNALGLKSSEMARMVQPGGQMSPTVDLHALWLEAVAKEGEIGAKLNVLTNQLAAVQTNVYGLDSNEQDILQAMNNVTTAEKAYENDKASAEQQANADISGSKLSNMNVIERPTPGFLDGKSINKITEGIFGGFFVLAFGLPFFIELVLDQSFKHASDVQARIAQPFFITIPQSKNGHHKTKALKRSKDVPLLPATGSSSPETAVKDTLIPLQPNGAVGPWDERHELRPYFETLRDRLMTYFEMINLTHKPKLVAVTSCAPGAGVTTAAAGLASSLSETGEGNVLLVSMNTGDGEVHHFYKGKLTCGIEEVLEKEKRNPAQVHEKLYVAEERDGGDGLPRILPKRFNHLVPMLKASDFDYIIFDMPPVSDISITPRLARFMDMVLLVIESGKTSRDTAVRVASLLSESKTNVGLVLNKNRSYMPKKLEQPI